MSLVVYRSDAAIPVSRLYEMQHDVKSGNILPGKAPGASSSDTRISRRCAAHRHKNRPWRVHIPMLLRASIADAVVVSTAVYRRQRGEQPIRERHVYCVPRIFLKRVEVQDSFPRGQRQLS
jgi:hypothetical protein